MALRLAISMGDYNGIGPEIIIKTLSQLITAGATPVVMGHRSVFEFYSNTLDYPLPSYAVITHPDEIKDGTVNFLNLESYASITPEPGNLTNHAGRAAMKAVETGIEWCQQKHTHALVTAPISKEAVNKAGYHIPGHTEFLADKTGTNEYVMLLVNDDLRVGLVTIHIPVVKIASQITIANILKNLRIINRTLKGDFNIPEPRIAVLGLNPHAGDGGIIGMEEIETLTPAIEKAREDEIKAEGPFPADGFFGKRKYMEYDCVLAMYHDQGLVPFKTLSFGGGVNVTGGLPIVRTSPDHGTAFDIAGKNVADPSSFQEATKLAIKLSKNRFNKNLATS